jgi:hypothetical protein
MRAADVRVGHWAFMVDGRSSGTTAFALLVPIQPTSQNRTPWAIAVGAEWYSPESNLLEAPRSSAERNSPRLRFINRNITRESMEVKVRARVISLRIMRVPGLRGWCFSDVSAKNKDRSVWPQASALDSTAWV